MNTTVNKKRIAVIKMPTKIGDIIIRLQEIASKLTNNSYFPTGWLAGTLNLTKFTNDIEAYINAEIAVKNNTAGAVSLRNSAYTIIQMDLQLILAMVQSEANANPTLAEAIIGSVGFFISNTHGRQKNRNAAYNTEIPGTVILTGDGTGAHEWEMSKDMITSINLPATTVAKTQVTGLTTGDVWYFRNRKVNSKKNTYNWCAWIMLKVGAGGKNLGGGLAGHAGSLPTA